MLVSHRLDHDNKVIVTTFAPEEVSLKLFITTFSRYQEEINNLPDFHTYHELVDFRPITNINISPGELKEFSHFTMANDKREIVTKLALLVDSAPAFALAKGYEMIRNYNPVSKKEVKVFSEMDMAYEWLKKDDQDLKARPA